MQYIYVIFQFVEKLNGYLKNLGKLSDKALVVR